MSLPVYILGQPTPAAADPLATAALHSPAGTVVTLSGDEGFHAVTVKRVTVGETITLTDGFGAAAEATVTATRGKNTLDATIITHRHDTPRPAPVTVIQAIPKSDRSEQTIDLLTQAGAAHITAWQADRCIAKWAGVKATKGLAKWASVATQAAKQSRRITLPGIDGPVTTSQLVERIRNYARAGTPVIMLHENAELSLASHVKHPDFVAAAPAGVVIIIGPEGGIGEQETHRLTEAGATPVRLGDEILRCATAGFATIAALNTHTGRWG